MTSTRDPSTFAIVVFAGLIALLLGVGGYLGEGGWTRDGAMAGARLTARIAFVWFVVAWSASALARLWPGGWRAQLLKRRRAVGLGFAAAHTVHLGALLIATLAFAAPTALPKLLGGALAYVFVAAMALTSNDSAVRALGPRNWKLLHATGGYVIALVFAFAYFGRLETHPWLAIPALALIGAAALLRLLAWSRRASAKAARA